MAECDEEPFVSPQSSKSIGDKYKHFPQENYIDETNNNPVLVIEIADAVSEKDRVVFTIQTKTSLPNFKASNVSVVRSHDDFIWLHNQFSENSEYAGLIIPPCPPRPDFTSSREKLVKLSESEGTLTEMEMTKLKTELEAEYLALFKKTVAMHDVFLKRLAAHPSLRSCYNLRIFLEYNEDLGIRNKTRRERFSGYFQRSMSESFSRLSLTNSVNQLDKDEELKDKRESLTQYHDALSQAVIQSDRVTQSHRDINSAMVLIHGAFTSLTTSDFTTPAVYSIMAELYDKLRMGELRIAADEDLKLSDSIRYYRDDSQAALALLQRRLRALHDFATANKTLEKSQNKSKDIVEEAERSQEAAFEKLKLLSDSARSELLDFRSRRINYLRRNLVELAELEIRTNKNQLQLMKSALDAFKSVL